LAAVRWGVDGGVGGAEAENQHRGCGGWIQNASQPPK
jgi:hypothetical protein